MADAATDFGVSQYQDKAVSAMRTALTAADASAYSAARLDSMTVNDMVYASKLVAAGTPGWVSPTG